MAPTTQVATLAAAFEIVGDEQARAVLRQVFSDVARTETASQRATQQAHAAATASTNLQRRYAMGAFQIAGVMQAVAASGRLSNENIKQLIAQASGIAFAFGPTGAIVGAVGLTTVAIAEMFSKTRRESDTTTDKLLENFRKVQFGSARELAGQAKQEQDRLTELQRQIQELEEEGRTRMAAAATTVREGLTPDVRAEDASINTKRIRELRNEMVKLEQQIAKTNQAVAAASQSESREQRAAKIVEDRTDALRKLNAERDAEATNLRRLNDLGVANRDHLERASQLERELARQLANTNLTLSERVALEQKLRDAHAAHGGLFQLITGTPRVGTPSTAGVDDALGRGAEAIAARNQRRIIESLANPAKITAAMQEIGGLGAQALATGLAVGLQGAFVSANIGQGIEALGRGLLGAFGNVLVQLGTQGLIANELVQKLFAFLGTPAGAAAAVGLILLGSALSAAAGGRGAGARAGTAGSGRRAFTDQSRTHSFDMVQSTVANSSGMKPSITQFNFQVIGGGPEAERRIKEIVNRATARGI